MPGTMSYSPWDIGMALQCYKSAHNLKEDVKGRTYSASVKVRFEMLNTLVVPLLRQGA